ncbi:MAG: AAA family ATPase [bacterium]
MQSLIETYHRLLKSIDSIYQRKFFSDFKLTNRITGVVGARGVGKTIFLLNYLKQKYQKTDKGIYVSADNLYFSENSLIDLADRFHKEYNGEIICIDEIHRYKNWNQELKNIYDSYPKMKIIFSGSSSLDLVKGRYDLSRRANLKYMSGFSFREFLEVKLKKEFPVFTLKNIINDGSKISKELSDISKLIGYLKEYYKQGYYPIFMELENYDDYKDALLGIINKTVFEDISSFYSLKTNNLDVFRKIIYFFATSKPGSLNVNNLSKSLGKDHTTIADYIEMLRESGLLRFLLINKQGHALIRNTEKVYLNNTNLFCAINNSIGKPIDLGQTRELFVVSHLMNAGYNVFFSKQGDIICDGYTLEIGGAGKKGKQIKEVKNSYLVKDDILISGGKQMPLYLFGFLE